MLNLYMQHHSFRVTLGSVRLFPFADINRRCILKGSTTRYLYFNSRHFCALWTKVSSSGCFNNLLHIICIQNTSQEMLWRQKWISQYYFSFVYLPVGLCECVCISSSYIYRVEVTCNKCCCPLHGHHRFSTWPQRLHGNGFLSHISAFFDGITNHVFNILKVGTREGTIPPGLVPACNKSPQAFAACNKSPQAFAHAGE